MNQLALAYTNLAEIDDLPPIDEADRRCLAELKGVLARHGRLDRFGVCLLHSHFPILAGEMLVETCDVDRRELLLRPVPLASVPSDQVRETAWRFDGESGTTACWKACVADGPAGTHKSKHVSR